MQREQWLDFVEQAVKATFISVSADERSKLLMTMTDSDTPTLVERSLGHPH